MGMEIRRSNRKTMVLEVTADAKVIVRAPLRMSEESIRHFIAEKQSWIEKSKRKMEERKKQQSDVEKLTKEELDALASRALAIFPKRTAFYAKKIGVSYGRITIRNQRSKWGSCSSKGNLNFNCLLMLAPREIYDYVIVHELCHRKEMNHSKAFWDEVEQVLPDYRERKQWLKEHGSSLMARNL